MKHATSASKNLPQNPFRLRPKILEIIRTLIPSQLDLILPKHPPNLDIAIAISILLLLTRRSSSSPLSSTPDSQLLQPPPLLLLILPPHPIQHLPALHPLQEHLILLAGLGVLRALPRLALRPLARDLLLEITPLEAAQVLEVEDVIVIKPALAPADDVPVQRLGADLGRPLAGELQPPVRVGLALVRGAPLLRLGRQEDARDRAEAAGFDEVFEGESLHQKRVSVGVNEFSTIGVLGEHYLVRTV